MNFSRPLALSIVIGATLVSLGFVAVSYSVDPSHMTHFFRYFWMVLYFLFTMAVMICADVGVPNSNRRTVATVQGWTILQTHRALGDKRPCAMACVLVPKPPLFVDRFRAGPGRPVLDWIQRKWRASERTQ
jgi:hypothetical protein